MLLNCAHDNPRSAALSIASNRASKINALRDSQPDIARRFADSLAVDVCEIIASGGMDGLERQLAEIVTDARKGLV